MDQNFVFNEIGTPCLIVNRMNLNVSSNKAFVSLFGYLIENSEQFILFQNPEFNFKFIQRMPPDSDICLYNAYRQIIFCTVKIRNLTENEILVSFEEHRMNKSSFSFSQLSGNVLQPFQIGIILYDLTNPKRIFVSPFILERSGYTLEDLQNRSWNEFIYPCDFSKKQDLLKELSTYGQQKIITEGRMATKSGKLLWVQEIIEKIKIGSKDFLQIYLCDKSSEKDAEAELARAKQKTENAELLKISFLNNIPHEIRTPLNAIIGFTSLLSDVNISTEERIEYAKFIQESSNDILNMVDNMIEIAKFDAYQVEPKYEKCLVNKMIDSIYEEAKDSQRKMEKESITITVTKSFADPTFSIYSDSEYIHRVFLHLIGNALKFTESGKIEIGYKLTSNKEISFFVKDSGIGISHDEKDLIFQKFGKSGDINTDKNRGAGLGLSLSKKMVELLGGEIHVDSRKGKESTFTFTIPIIETAPKVAVEKVNSIHGEINWSSKTILIAEDNEVNYKFLEKYLRKTRINLLWAKNGKEAIDMFKQYNEIDLVLMDILMPEIDGFDATREIKKLDKNMPIIAQTALAFPEDEDLCYQAGCNYVLVKPINNEELISTLRNFMK